MSVKIGDIAPDFRADTTEGTIHFHDWLGESWAVLFSHPKDLTPVVNLEFRSMESIKAEFDRRRVRIIGLSCDLVGTRGDWGREVEKTQGTPLSYPIIADIDLNVSKLYGMLPVDGIEGLAGPTPVFHETVRNLFVIAPDKKVKVILACPLTPERNFDLVLRVIDTLELAVDDKVVMPA
jgi:alkyl hydroperoxide reductase subunit AhpC